MKKIFGIYLIFMLLSCTEKKREKESRNDTDTPVKSSPKTDTIKNIPADFNNEVIIAKFLKDSTATTINGLLKGGSHRVSVYVNIKNGKNLSAILNTKDPKANIRINQVFTPDGKSDGPFGKEMNQPLLRQGMYKLIIGHDLMADGASEVKFELRLIVK